MEALRTPDDRFTGLPGHPFAPHYVEAGGLRIHYVDEGPRDAAPVLLLHGEPSWSYLYRKMIPLITAAGHRAIAPDLVGFGRSDKPVRREDYTYQRHVEWMRGMLEQLELRNVTMVGQDWGGLIGLRLAAEHPDRFARLVPANTGLPTGEQRMPEIWHQFRAAIRSAPRLDVGRFVQSGCRKPLSPEVLAGYDAPFPDDTYTAGPRAMPGLVPITPDDPAGPANRAAWAALGELPIPMLVAFSDGDPITGPMAPVLKRHAAGAQ